LGSSSTTASFSVSLRYGILIGLPLYWGYTGYTRYKTNKNQVELFNPDDAEQWNRAVKAQWAMTPKQQREKQEGDLLRK